jgi:IS5 family transposase
VIFEYFAKKRQHFDREYVMYFKEILIGDKMRFIFSDQKDLEFQPFDPRDGAELAKIDEILKNNDVLKDVEKDLTRGVSKSKGRPGMSSEQVLRALIVKQLYDWDYRLLRERVLDSTLLRRFCRFEWQRVPTFQAFQENIKKLTPETLESINRTLVKFAKDRKIETGKDIRTDTTVVETNIHYPTDSSLIWDSVRVITRILERALYDLPGAGVIFKDRTRVVKKRMKAVYDARNDEKRKPLYVDLLKYGAEVLGYAREGAKKLILFAKRTDIVIDEAFLAEAYGKELQRYAELLERILNQTRRRVIDGENVPANEKIVSIFEDHTDIIVKSRRETEFGHKVCFAVGKSSIVLDCMIDRGNPADASLFARVIDRQVDLYGEAPRSTAADGGFASLYNAKYAKDSGVDNVYFNKQVGKETEKLFPSAWLRKKMRKFRAGIEGVISALKRGVGLGRSMWRSWKSFNSYVWASVITHNLKTMARILITKEGALAASGG